MSKTIVRPAEEPPVRLLVKDFQEHEAREEARLAHGREAAKLAREGKPFLERCKLWVHQHCGKTLRGDTCGRELSIEMKPVPPTAAFYRKELVKEIGERKVAAREAQATGTRETLVIRRAA